MRQPTDHQIIVRKLPSGERLPLLLGTNGVPLWYPTLFATAVYRNASRSPNSTRAALNTVRMIIRWANDRGCSLEDRFGRGDLLNTSDIEGLTSYLMTRAADKAVEHAPPRPPLRSKEHARAAPSRRQATALSSGERYARLSYAALYLRWLAIRRIEEEAKHVNDERLDQIVAMTAKLLARRPPSRRSQVAPVFALSPTQEAEFANQAAAPESTSPYALHVAQRNDLIVSMLRELGLRIGELLAIKVADIQFQANEIVIPRRHNDIDDSRAMQPSAKTLDRRLPLSDHLASKLHSYILGCRKAYLGARFHPFLFVSLRSSKCGQAGKPLSLNAVQKMFRDVCAKMSPPPWIHAHMLRHGAATRMAIHLHSLGRSEAEMARSLNYTFGWADGSTTYLRYIKQFQHEAAMNAQISMQNKITSPK